jgi:hypothetical protein
MGRKEKKKRRSRLVFQNLAVSWDAALVPGGGPGEEREMRGKCSDGQRRKVWKIGEMKRWLEDEEDCPFEKK